jgi:ZW10 C-terminal helical domain
MRYTTCYIYIYVCVCVRACEPGQDDERFRSIQLALKQVAFKLGILSNVMREVLPPVLFSRAMGDVLSHSLQSIICEVLSLEDVGEAEGTNLRTAFLEFAQRLSQVFTRDRARAEHANTTQRRTRSHQRLRNSRVSDESAGTAPVSARDINGDDPLPLQRLSSFRTVELLCVHCEQWVHFHKLVDILDLPLRRIVEYYVAGELTEFSPAQLRHLITALFCESPLRRSSLATISD